MKGYAAVTFNSCDKKIDNNGFTLIEFCTLIIDLKRDLDTIWKDMSKSSCRYAIKKAKKDGIEVKTNTNYEEFIILNNSFRDAKKLSKSYINDIELMKKIGTLFVSKLDDEILGGNFFINDGKNMRWLIGASKRLEVDKKKATLIGNANKLIIWEAMKFGKKNGINTFDLGGFSLDKNNHEKMRINSFKKGFGGELKTFYYYSKSYSKLYSILYDIINKFK